MSALAPVLLEAFSFSKRGIRKAAVFPEPVLAMATTSWSRQHGVGSRQMEAGSREQGAGNGSRL